MSSKTSDTSAALAMIRALHRIFDGNRGYYSLAGEEYWRFSVNADDSTVRISLVVETENWVDGQPMMVGDEPYDDYVKDIPASPFHDRAVTISPRSPAVKREEI